jgi:hypothetical protein
MILMINQDNPANPINPGSIPYFFFYLCELCVSAVKIYELIGVKKRKRIFR